MKFVVTSVSMPPPTIRINATKYKDGFRVTGSSNTPLKFSFNGNWLDPVFDPTVIPVWEKLSLGRVSDSDTHEFFDRDAKLRIFCNEWLYQSYGPKAAHDPTLEEMRQCDGEVLGFSFHQLLKLEWLVSSGRYLISQNIGGVMIFHQVEEPSGEAVVGRPALVQLWDEVIGHPLIVEIRKTFIAQNNTALETLIKPLKTIVDHERSEDTAMHDGTPIVDGYDLDDAGEPCTTALELFREDKTALVFFL